MSVSNDVLRVNNSFFSSFGPFVVTVSVIIFLMLINAGRKRSHRREKLKESCRYVNCVESLITRGICFPNIKFVIRF